MLLVTLMSLWTEHTSYWESTAKWQSKNWYSQRKFRISGSIVAGILGRSKFSNPSSATMSLLKVYSTPRNSAMTYGIEHEDTAREWYCQKYSYQVKEAGFAIPKYNLSVGATVDGIVGDDGIIEIKCPQKMYAVLTDYSQDDYRRIYDPTQSDSDSTEYSETESLREVYYRHIFESHYSQMQLGMYSLSRQWCDYIVWTETQGKFTQRVYYDKIYMDSLLLEIREYQDDILTPILNQLNLELLPPPKLVSNKRPSKKKCLEVIHDVFVDRSEYKCLCDKGYDLTSCLLQELN